jgi:Cu(I)/Ag(I) efflux system membrane fusion protein
MVSDRRENMTEKGMWRRVGWRLWWPAIIIFILAAFVSGYYLALFRSHSEPESGKEHQAPSHTAHKDRSSHTDMVHGAGHEARLTMSKEAKKLAELETAEVKRRPAHVKLRMVGMVFHDESRVASLTSRVDGRLDKVFVDFTGLSVKKGDPMVTIWSRTLVTSQVELFETIRSPEHGESMVKGAEEKLKQLGLTEEQIQNIRRRKKPDLYITLKSPINGVVMKKNVNLGDFVKEGTVMYEIADLSKVWVKLDAFETGLFWIKYGQAVTFTTPAVPGRTFRGQVVFIDPVLDMGTRSVKVRVVADNEDLVLKPHMFVSAELEAEVDSNGNIIKSNWAGKYICPIYPDQVFDKPGICHLSNLPLRPAASYGYSPDENPILPLVIPATAVLYTGKRSIVYVEVPDQDKPTYELRQVRLGPRAGDSYVIYGGLHEGERVVTKGNFKIDSASQILAQTSMMNPAQMTMPADLFKQLEERVGREEYRAPNAFGPVLVRVFKGYSNLKNALADGTTAVAIKYSKQLMELLHGVRVDFPDTASSNFWSRMSDRMTDALKQIVDKRDLALQRKAFQDLSEALTTVLLGFRRTAGSSFYIYHCPTASDFARSYWVEATQHFSNPYLGKDKKCGKLIGTIHAKKPPTHNKDKSTTKPSHPMDKESPKHGSATEHDPPSEGSSQKIHNRNHQPSSTSH